MTSNAQPAFACPTRERHCAGCLSGGGKTRKLAARVRRAALAVIDLRTLEEHCIGGIPLSFRARPLCDVQAVNFNAQPAFACPTRERHCAGSLSGGGKTRKLAACARRATLVAIGLRDMERHYNGGRPLSFHARPWCDVRAVTSNAQPAFAWHARKPHCAGCLSGGGERRELASRANRAALVVIVLRTIEWHCIGGRPIFLSVQDRGATCELWPPTRSRHSRGTRQRATALAVSREVAKNASLPRARAVPRWL